jgi:hypothetical protein
MVKLPSANSQQLKLTPKEPTLLFAIQELFRTGGVDFNEWWDEYKKGFPLRKKIKKSNYPLEQWTEPKYVELVPLGGENKSGVREIEYFPNKNDDSVSYLIRGNDHDLIFHITAIGYQQSGNSDEKISGRNSKPPLKGFPAIKLLFASESNHIAVKTIRCVGFTDSKKIADMGLAKLIKPSDVAGWASKIKTIFGDTNYKWSKGVECLSYSGQVARLQGIEGYAYVKNKSDGIALFTAMLKIFNATPDKDGFNYSGKDNESQFANAKTPLTTEVLNKTIKVESNRPQVDCYFISAQLQLPLLKKPIPLIKKNVIVYKS